MKSTFFLTIGLAFSSVAFAQSASTMVDSSKDEMKSTMVEPAKEEMKSTAVETTDAVKKPLLIKPKNQAQPTSETKTNTDESMDDMKEMKDDHDHDKHDHDHDHDMDHKDDMSKKKHQ